MNAIYSELTRGRNQWDAYQRNIKRHATNIVTIRGDSKSVTLPTDLQLCFSFIDGNHDPSYIRSDFDLAWAYTVRGGVVGFDDYGFDLPQVTESIDQIIAGKLWRIIGNLDN